MVLADRKHPCEVVPALSITLASWISWNVFGTSKQLTVSDDPYAIR